jgi:hypothetical protein
VRERKKKKVDCKKPKLEADVRDLQSSDDEEEACGEEEKKEGETLLKSRA